MAGPGAARACRATWPSSGPSGPASIAAGPQTSVAVSRQSLAICEAISLPSDASGPGGPPASAAARPRSPFQALIWQMVWSRASSWRTSGSASRPRSAASRISGPAPAAADPGAEAGALVSERGAGDRPPSVELADQVARRHPRAGQEHLVEQGVTGHLPQRPDLDPWLAHAEREVADPVVLRGAGIGPGQQHAVVGDLGQRGPDLLPVDDELFAVTPRPGGQAGQVRARARLAEQLAPGVLTGEQRAQEAALLLLGAVVYDRRPGEHDAQARWRARRARGGELLLGGRGQGGRQALAVPAPRPGRGRPA